MSTYAAQDGKPELLIQGYIPALNSFRFFPLSSNQYAGKAAYRSAFFTGPDVTNTSFHTGAASCMNDTCKYQAYYPSDPAYSPVYADMVRGLHATLCA